MEDIQDPGGAEKDIENLQGGRNIRSVKIM
jgi:hypothetical protein